MFSPAVQHRKSRGGLLVSAAAHLAVFALLLLTLGPRVRPVYRESRCCTAALYWTGSTGQGTTKAPAAPHKVHQRHAPAPPRPTHATPAPVAPAPAASQTSTVASQQQQASPGTGTGAENAEPALPLFFPAPGVRDRSLLPSSEQNIVVNVSISALGEVTDEQLVRGFGNPLDQMVLTTVKSWRFRPAMLNGAAIASTEQLVFPFSQNSPGAPA